MTTSASARTATTTLSREPALLLIIVAIFNWVALMLYARSVTLDFTGLYTGGMLLLHGQHHQLYNLATQATEQARLFHFQSPLPYNHLAYEALLFAPLAALSFHTALWVWRVLNVAVLLMSVHGLSALFALPRPMVALLLLAFLPVSLAVVQGQDSLLLLAAITGCLCMLQQRRGFAAGLLLSCACFKPHLVLPLAIVLLLRREIRFAFGFACGAIAWVALSIAVTGLDGWWQMIALLRYEASGTSGLAADGAWSHPNLIGALLSLHLAPPLTQMLYVLLAASLLAATAWKMRAVPSLQQVAAVTLALTVLVAPHITLHDFTLLVVPIFTLSLRVVRAPSLLYAIGLALCYAMFPLMVLGPLSFFLLAAYVMWSAMGVATQSTAETSHS
ncbi:MAG: DUF2029 domain-containing protein [Acidobacteriota bacterium]|nr:DUF2029 domain-containing protein [Acidobacteriota bacterium]